MTPGADKIDKLISHSITDWSVTDADEIAVLGVLRGDPTPSETVEDLDKAGRLEVLLDRVTTNRRQLVELLGGRVSPMTALSIKNRVVLLHADYAFRFTISNELQNNLARFLTPGSYVCTGPATRVIVSGPSDRPFTGSGATGTDAATLSIPLVDQVLLLAGHAETTRRYINPLGNLKTYLSSLSSTERLGQAHTLLQQSLVSYVPGSYARPMPERLAVVRAAAVAHNLDGATVAAIILAEQRDQSRNEDAKDLIAATSVKQANTSIGLGQVVVSTVRRNDLFADLLSPATRGGLTHSQIAGLLASDEFNIFATARYIRIVADAGSKSNISSLPNTQATFPGINLAAYAGNSPMWPTDNIRALGSEYTSKAWDDALVPAWGEFVLQARQDIRASGVFQ